METKLKDLSASNMSAILYKQNLHATGKKVNDTVAWPAYYEEEGVPFDPDMIIPTYIFNITGTFNYFPKLFNYAPELIFSEL